MALAAPALAEEPSAAGVEASAKDIVRLKNGGMLRGTISELVPGETVTIVTVAGKTREIKMSEVAYAGPADEAPEQDAPAPPPTPTPAPAAAPVAAPSTITTSEPSKVEPYVTVQGRRATLHLESEPSGLTFHRASSSAVAVGPGGVAMALGYDRLCTAPCQITIPAGTEVLALSRPGERAFTAGPVTIPAGESRLVGKFESRAGLRATGWVITAASVVGGLALMYVALSSTERECDRYSGACRDSPRANLPPLIGGTVVLAVGAPIGIVMATMVPDKAKVDVAGARPATMPTARTLALRGNF